MDESISDLFWDQIAEVGGRREVDELIDLITRHPALTKDLVRALNEDQTRRMKGAAWVLSHLGESHGDLLQPYFESLLARLEQNPPEPVRRAIFRYLQYATLPPEQHGRLWELGTLTLQSPGWGTAPRVFALEMLFRLAKFHPGLGHELKTILEMILPEATPGLASKGRKILRSLGRFSDQE